ncbi:MAG: PIN domain-containing protein [Candidatus Bathyarchaeia archaeon]|jgi:predicted nucleic acid-binding protein
MSSRYVVDSYAWIEYLDGTEIGRKVSDLIKENNEIFTCVLTIAEVVSKAARKGKDVKIAYDVLTSNSKIIDADEELSLRVGLLHFEMRKTVKDFGLADAYILATAGKLKAKILTGDIHFKNMKEAVLIK